MYRISMLAVLLSSLLAGVFLVTYGCGPYGLGWHGFPSPLPMPNSPLPKPTHSDKIAFVSNREGQSGIYIMNIDGSNQTRLIKSVAKCLSFSPDGTRIAFSSLIGAHMDIYIMNVDGSNQINISNTSEYDELFPTWSSDGTRIAFTSSYGSKYEICTISSDGSNMKRLVTFPTGGWFPALSPDGSNIAFASDGFASGEYNEDIYVINADGKNPRRLTTDLAEERCPAWSPDGKRIAFSSTRNGKWQIYVMDADGSNQLRLTNNSAKDFGPTWSPDGSKIAFESDRDGNLEIYIMNADGSNQARLTNNPADDIYAALDCASPLSPYTATNQTPSTSTVSPIENNNDLSVLSHYMYRDNMGNVHIVGEFQNTGSKNTTGNRVKVTVFNFEGSIVATGQSLSYLSALKPNQKCPFEIILSVPSYTINYKLETECQSTDKESVSDIDIKDDYIKVLAGGWSKLQGKITNRGNGAYESVLIVITFYDKDGRVVEVGTTSPDTLPLSPGNSCTFKMGINPYISAKVVKYMIQADGVR